MLLVLSLVACDPLVWPTAASPGVHTGGRARQIVVVQDITGSFRDDIAFAREGDRQLLAALESTAIPGDLAGMTVFVGGTTADPWSPLDALPSADLDARWAGLDWCNCEPGALLDHYGPADRFCTPAHCPLPDWPTYCVDTQGGVDARPAVPDCWSIGTNTAQGPAMEQAIDMLLVDGWPGAFQALVVVSDGAPCCGTETAPRQQDALDAADRADAHGISVWTVQFGEGDPSFLASLVRGQGHHHPVGDATRLTPTIAGLAEEIAAASPR